MDTLIQTLAFPSSALLAAFFLLAAYALYHFAQENWIVKTLGSIRTARILLILGAILLAVEGTWSVPLHHSFAFTLYAAVLLLSLAITLLNGMKKKAKMGFILNHLGIFIILWAALFGAPDVNRSKMMVGREQPMNFSYTSEGLIIPLPFQVTLEDFRIDYYPDGKSPRQFTSVLTIGGEKMEVSVNHPGKYQGYTIFQDSYDLEAERYTVLQLVRDPWLPFIYLGMALLAAGSILLLFAKWKVKLVVPITLSLTALFTVLTVAKINFGTLMPALRSWWFVPHLFIYMLAYSLMAMSLVAWLAGSWRQKEQWQILSDRFMRSSSALLIIGMITGSIWARQAWGDYWAWDPKENWAAATWLLSLMHLHLQNKRGWKAITILILAFLALQITWYGIHYLPSAMDSLHTYNN